MRKCVAAAVLTLLSATAYAQDVKIDHDPAYDFGKIKTFAIRIGTAWGNPLGENRVIKEFEEALTAKGWTKTDETKADAFVILHGASRRSGRSTRSTAGYGGYGYRGWGGMGGMGTATTRENEYLVATLVVDIFDMRTKSLVFRGTATDELSDKPEKNQKKLEKASDKMFKNFPPGSAKK